MFDMTRVEENDKKREQQKHPKCKGYKEWTSYGYEYDCGYGTELICEDCKYGMGRKDPEAKCNQTT